jgi:hypothetical protein
MRGQDSGERAREREKERERGSESERTVFICSYIYCN